MAHATRRYLATAAVIIGTAVGVGDTPRAAHAATVQFRQRQSDAIGSTCLPDRQWVPLYAGCDAGWLRIHVFYNWTGYRLRVTSFTLDMHENGADIHVGWADCWWTGYHLSCGANYSVTQSDKLNVTVTLGPIAVSLDKSYNSSESHGFRISIAPNGTVVNQARW